MKKIKKKNQLRDICYKNSINFFFFLDREKKKLYKFFLFFYFFIL